jgi:hypothetical protein
MGTKLIVVDGQSLLNLLIHYTDGAIDLDSKLINVGVSQYLGEWVGIVVESSQWKDPKLTGQDAYGPLHIRYEGKKILKWSEKGTPYDWQQEGKGFEVPK